MSITTIRADRFGRGRTREKSATRTGGSLSRSAGGAAARSAVAVNACLLAAALMGGAAHAQVTTAWVNAPGGASVATDAADNVYTTYGVQAPGSDIFLTKRDSSGNILWEVSPDHNLDSTRYEVPRWVETDRVGNIVVIGNQMSGFSNPVNASSIAMKFGPSGNLIWRRVFEGTFEGSYTVKALIDADNNIYVLGTGFGPPGLVTRVRKFAPDGTTLWSYFDPGILGSPLNFKFTPDGNILIAGQGTSTNGFSKIGKNGVNIWNYFVNSLTSGDAAGDSLGNTYVVHGEYLFGSSTGSFIKKLSPAGTVIWQRPQAMVGFRVEVGSDDKPVISGFPGGTLGAAFMKYNGDGTVAWQNLDADGPALALFSHAQMRLDASNNAYLAGAAFFDGLNVCKVNSDGTSAWTSSASSGAAVSFAFGSDNSVYAVSNNISTARFVQTPTTVNSTDLSLTMTDAPDPVRRGANLVYTLRASNGGPNNASGVVLRDTLPANVTFVSATLTGSAGGCSVSAGTVSCPVGALNAGAQVTATITVRPQTRGTLNNSARVTAGTTDPNTANNSASASTTVR